jgi:hypothetical protein
VKYLPLWHEAHILIAKQYLILVVTESEFWNDEWFIGVWRLPLDPHLLSVDPVPLATPLVVVPGLLLLDGIDHFERLDHRGKAIRWHYFQHCRQLFDVLELLRLLISIMCASLLLDPVELPTHDQHILLHDVHLLVL